MPPQGCCGGALQRLQGCVQRRGAAGRDPGEGDQVLHRHEERRPRRAHNQVRGTSGEEGALRAQRPQRRAVHALHSTPGNLKTFRRYLTSLCKLKQEKYKIIKKMENFYLRTEG